jgi:predicted component of type VI protein secretion system
MTLIIEVSCTSSGDTKRFVLEDGQSLEVGRSNEELHLFNDPRLSRRHFEVRYADGQITIKHLSRTNPTLVASDGSTDFQKVEGKRSEMGGCRIIAGSHRFVLMVEKADSVLENTMSGGEPSDLWSDVEDVHEVQDDWKVESVAPTNRTAPTPASRVKKTVKDEQPPPIPKPQRSKTNLFDDDDSPPKEARSRPPIKEPTKKVKKPFFPVTDDFFDD